MRDTNLFLHVKSSFSVFIPSQLIFTRLTVSPLGNHPETVFRNITPLTPPSNIHTGTVGRVNRMLSPLHLSTVLHIRSRF